MHNKCHTLELSRNHLPHPQSVEKLSSTKLVPGAKNVGDCCSRRFNDKIGLSLKMELGNSKTVLVQIFFVNSASELQSWNLVGICIWICQTSQTLSKMKHLLIHPWICFSSGFAISVPLCIQLLKPETWVISKSLHPSLLFFFNLKKYLFIYLFLAALGLHCCAWAFSRCGEQGLLFVAVRGLLIAVASLVVEHGL